MLTLAVDDERETCSSGEQERTAYQTGGPFWRPARAVQSLEITIHSKGSPSSDRFTWIYLSLVFCLSFIPRGARLLIIHLDLSFSRFLFLILYQTLSHTLCLYLFPSQRHYFPLISFLFPLLLLSLFHLLPRVGLSVKLFPPSLCPL